MGNQVNPPTTGANYVLVTFFGITSCDPDFFTAPNGTYYLEETSLNYYECLEDDVLFIFVPNVALIAYKLTGNYQVYADNGNPPLPGFSTSEVESGQCFFACIAYGGNALITAYINNEPAVLCNDYGLHPDLPDKYEVNHIEADSVTYRIANAQDGTNFLIKTDFP